MSAGGGGGGGPIVVPPETELEQTFLAPVVTGKFVFSANPKSGRVAVIDAESYKNRFTPRRKGSNWSAVNIRRIHELRAQGLVRPAGWAAFEAAVEAKKAVYSYERAQAPELGEEFEALFRAEPAGWDYFQASAPWYRTAAISWVVSAKRDETRRKRLETLIADSAAERRIAPLSRRKASE